MLDEEGEHAAAMLLTVQAHRLERGSVPQRRQPGILAGYIALSACSKTSRAVGLPHQPLATLKEDRDGGDFDEGVEVLRRPLEHGVQLKGG
ncbi:hypothetical protein [Azospirillum sp.]|uniref:hypothetical protein n=1 Tax=Azospirillum sp. TaxID=34012 RepID=UPI002D581D86|nr:hypothetical protein [Azospirillum sp.]HYF88057.1 hypothetical protein [Azospirillum sp.]